VADTSISWRTVYVLRDRDAETDRYIFYSGSSIVLHCFNCANVGGKPF